MVGASDLRLTVGDYDIPKNALRYVRVTFGPYPVSFGGMIGGDEASELVRKLRLLAEQRAIRYEAVDNEGLSSEGICNLVHLRFERIAAHPSLTRFSGQLAHPFIA